MYGRLVQVPQLVLLDLTQDSFDVTAAGLYNLDRNAAAEVRGATGAGDAGAPRRCCRLRPAVLQRSPFAAAF